MPKVTRDTNNNTKKSLINRDRHFTDDKRLHDAVIEVLNNPETKFENSGMKRGIGALLSGYNPIMSAKCALNYMAKNDEAGFALFVKTHDKYKIETAMAHLIEQWVAITKSTIRSDRAEEFEKRKQEFLHSQKCKEIRSQLH